MTRKERIAELRQELSRLEREERESRPALAAGQVWKSPQGTAILAQVVGKPDCMVSVRIEDWTAYLHEHASLRPLLPEFEYVGLARDVLRVDVPGEVAAPPSAPPQAEPTGAELVPGCKVWRRGGHTTEWCGPDFLVSLPTAESPYYKTSYRIDGIVSLWSEAKLYREGVAP